MDDTISRQTVLDALDEISREVDDGYGFDYAKWREYFCELPPVLGTNLAEVGTDCISRQAAIDALNGEIEITGRTNAEAVKGYVRLVKDRLERLPSAQPEIIRCKDCKHYQYADNRAFGFPVRRCEWTGFEDVDDNDFCSRAERREVAE